MARVTRQAVLDREALAHLLRPRDGVVLERATTGGGSTGAAFEAAEGPVLHYRRTVSTDDRPDGTVAVEQTVEFQLALPWFGWLFVPLVKAHVGRIRPRASTPWWAPPQRLDARAATSLGTIAALAAVVGYTGYLVSQTMTYAADEFDVSTAGQGVGLAFLRLDFLVALPLVALADRRGRRPALLLTAGASCALATLGALAPTLPGLVATQIPARGCAVAAGIVIGIVAAEEMPAGSRAWSLGVLALGTAVGSATLLGLLFLADVASWRVLYLVSLAGVPLVVRFGRGLTETRRYGVAHPQGRIPGHGRRLWLLAGSALLLNLFLGPASQFQNEFLNEERNFSAARIAVFIAATNVWGGIGIVVGGRLADVRGRRPIAAFAVAAGTIATVFMYNAVGWPVWMWSTVGSVLGAAIIPALGVYGPELFPTGLRGRANGVITGLGRVGSVLGLVAASTPAALSRAATARPM